MASAPLPTGRWRIELFGTLRASHGDVALRGFASRRVAALLARLAASPTRSASREELIDLFWEDMELPSARHNLRQTLFSLRRALERPGLPTAVCADHDKIWLDPASVITDVEEFEEAARAARRLPRAEAIEALTQAAALYRGELLSDRYEEWIFPERRRLEAAYLSVLRDLQELLLQEGDPLEAAQHALRVVAANPYEEEPHLAVMRLFAAAGRPDLVERQLRELKRVVREELGETISGETTGIAERLLAESRSRAVELEAMPAMPAPRLTSSPLAAPRRRLFAPALAAAVMALFAFAFYYTTLQAESQTPGTADAAFQQLAGLRDLPATGPEGSRNRERHADLCLNLAEQAWSAWYGPQEEKWARRLEAGQDDFRIAIRWQLDHEPEKALRTAGALTRFWFLRDHAREGHRWLAEALEKAPSTRTDARARALVGTAFLSDVHGEPQNAQCREAFDIYHKLGNVWGEAHALRHLGFFASERQQYAPGRALYEEALGRFQRLRDARGEAVTLLCLGFLAPDPVDAVGFAQSRAWGSRSLALFKKLGNAWGVSMATAQLGSAALRLSDSAEAEKLYLASLENDPSVIASIKNLELRASICLMHKHVEQGRALFAKALVLSRDQGDRMTASRLLFDYAREFREWGDDRSVRLLGASAILDRSLDARQEGESCKLRNIAEQDCRDHMDAGRFDALYREGENLAWTEAIDEILMSLPRK